MNDFLGNLASRSLNLAPVIQPRPMSRFEPWPMTDGPETAHHNFAPPPVIEHAIDPVEAERTRLHHESDTPLPTRFDRPWPESYEPVAETSRAPTRTPALEPQPTVTLPAVLMPTPILSQPVPRERDDSNETVTSTSSEPSALIRGDGAVTTPRTPPAAQPTVERTERVIVEHERVVLERETPAAVNSVRDAALMPLSPAPRVELLPTVERTPAPRVIVEREQTNQGGDDRPGTARTTIAPLSAPIGSDTRSAAHPLVTPIVERVERIRENPDRAQLDRSGPGRSQQPAPLASARSDRPSAPPTIHVTIGRIEVRATPPPTSVKRASQSAATMSLEEYLRSRSGGKR